MRKMKFQTRLRLLIVLTLLLVVLTSYAVGKYITTVQTPGTVTFTAKLAETFVLRERTAARNADGTYTLSEPYITNNAATPQSYVLIPGLDVPKDPHIVITGKTKIPAYLYIEIVDTLDTVKINGEDVKLIDYELTSDWEETTEKAKQHGGTVYVYTGGSADPIQLIADPAQPIYILQNNEVTVSQHIKHADDTANGDTDILTFYAYLEEVVPTDP